MTGPYVVQLDAELAERLQRCADTSPGVSADDLAQRLVEEGLRQFEHPGVVFKDGPSGRRAALALGPDVWEVARALRDVDEPEQAAVETVAEVLTLSVGRVRIALRYIAAYEAEVDAETAAAECASSEAEEDWCRELD